MIKSMIASRTQTAPNQAELQKNIRKWFYVQQSKSQNIQAHKGNFWKIEKTKKYTNEQKNRILNYLDRNGIHTQVLDNKVLKGTKYFYLNEADAYQFRTQERKLLVFEKNEIVVQNQILKHN